MKTRNHRFSSGVFASTSGCGRPARATTTRGRELLHWIMARVRCGTGALALPVGCTWVSSDTSGPKLSMPSSDPEGVLLTNVIDVGTIRPRLPKMWVGDQCVQ